MLRSLPHEKRATRFWGLRRSGNHAVITWIMSAGDGSRQVFYNNCHPGKSASLSFTQLEIGGAVYPWRYCASRKGAEILASAARARDIYISYEDANPCRLAEAGGRGLTPDFDDVIHRDVIVTRSLLNWLASFVKLLAQDQEGSEKLWLTADQSALVLRMISLWRQTDQFVRAKEFQNDPRFLWIDYDRWVADAALRETLIRQLGHQGAVPPKPDVASYGGGSSFDRLAFLGRAEEMDVQNRWKKLKNDPAFRAIVTLLLLDAELVDQLRANHPDTLDILGAEFGWSDHAAARKDVQNAAP